MSRARVAGLAVASLLTLAGDALAQEALGARAARAEALVDSLARVDRATHAAALAVAAQGRSGPVAVVLRSGSPAQLVAKDVWRAFEPLGSASNAEIERVVLVEDGVASPRDSVGGREAVVFGRTGGYESGNSEAIAAGIANSAIAALSAVLLKDSLVAAWLQRRFDPRLEADAQKTQTVVELIDGRWTSTRRCLSGSAPDCAVYLGIELHPDLRERFPVPDIRRLLRLQASRGGALDQRRYDCVDGDDSACAEVWGDPGEPPAGWDARAALVLFVRERYGADAWRRVMADTTRNLGARFTRATGQQPAALAEQWRDWVLEKASHTPVTAGFKEITLTLLASGVLLALAARSGRWRA